MRFSPHAVDLLRRRCEAESTRSFNARGITLKRCEFCQLGLKTCICEWRKARCSELQFVLIMHRDEVYKPTNTGRLIADVFPHQCQAFLWNRTQPDEALLALLNDRNRHCQLVFPAGEQELREVHHRPLKPQTVNAPINTIVLLDGTWKQARKMYSQAKWMKHLPLLDLSSTLKNSEQDWGNYRVRQACEEGQLATAEAAALALAANREIRASEHLLNYFSVFNEHYVATRANTQPRPLPAHQYLTEIDTH
ncbi:MAG: tRNA-uridine aminocarboxypropyltransferase [Cellvibrionaceae bacterium]